MTVKGVDNRVRMLYRDPARVVTKTEKSMRSHKPWCLHDG